MLPPPEPGADFVVIVYVLAKLPTINIPLVAVAYVAAEVSRTRIVSPLCTTLVPEVYSQLFTEYCQPIILVTVGLLTQEIVITFDS